MVKVLSAVQKNVLITSMNFTGKVNMKLGDRKQDTGDSGWLTIQPTWYVHP